MYCVIYHQICQVLFLGMGVGYVSWGMQEDQFINFFCLGYNFKKG